MKNLFLVCLCLYPFLSWCQIDSRTLFEYEGELNKARPGVVLQINNSSYLYKGLGYGDIPKVKRFEAGDTLSIRFLKRKKYGTLVKSFEVHGLTICQEYASGRHFRQVYRDSLFSSEWKRSYSISLNNKGINEDGLGGLFYVRFDSVILIDRDNRTHIIGGGRWGNSWTMYFEILSEKDPFIIEHGTPKIELWVNGKPIEEDQLIWKTDILEARIKYPDGVDVEESEFSVSNLSVIERSCSGFFNYEKIQQEVSFPISVPNLSSIYGKGGSFYLNFGDLYHTNREGKKYRISYPRDKYTMWYHKARPK
ncbi:MAG: hypothetical protein AAGI38_00470 [Bacteroidota bacterium]